MTPRELADELAAQAEQRIAAGGLGLVCAVVAAGEAPHIVDVPRTEVTGPASLAAAWERVRGLMEARRATVGGVVADLALVDEDPQPGDGDAYEVQAESVEGAGVAITVGYRVRRFRGLQTAGRMYGEPDKLWLTRDA